MELPLDTWVEDADEDFLFENISRTLEVCMQCVFVYSVCKVPQLQDSFLFPQVGILLDTTSASGVLTPDASKSRFASRRVFDWAER